MEPMDVDAKNPLDIAESLPIHICEQIFSNLKVPDLLEAAAVCRSWRDIIERSNQCIDKVILHFKNQDIDRKLQQIYLKSNRKYQHLWIDKATIFAYNEEFFKKFQWKSVTLKDCKIDSIYLQC